MTESASNGNSVSVIGLLWVSLIVLKIIGYLENLSWWIILFFPVLSFMAGILILFILTVIGGILAIILLNKK